MNRRLFPWLGVAGLQLLGACSGVISCGGCPGLDPIPGGFDPVARIDRAAEVRLTQSGLDFIGSEFSNLVSAYAEMKCGAAEPVPCPTDFRLGGQPRPTACSAASQTCVHASTQAKEPVLGFEIDRAVQSGATVCRDDAANPNRRQCFAWLRLEGLALRPVPPNSLEATINAQIYTTAIPLRYDPLGMDCLVTLDSNASGASQQEFVVTVEIGEWTPPSGNDGRQLELRVTDLTSAIPDGDIEIVRDPVEGGLDDILSCGLANLPAVKTALVGRLVGSLAAVIDDEISKVIGRQCNRPGNLPCPVGTQCNADNRCENPADQRVVPQQIGAEGRIDFAQQLAGIGSPTAGTGDMSFRVGGTSGVDTSGANIGMLGGMEAAARDPGCSIASASPRTRSSFRPPSALPTASTVDLDFDGTPERPFMLLGAASQPFLDQAIWTAYQSGLFCAAVSSYDVDLLNTGSLAVLMPSLAQLTHSDRYPWSVWPARITVRPLAEPTIEIGEGRTSGTPPNLSLESPLLTIRLTDLELRFTALIEERWVHLMTMTIDLALPVGLAATPTGEIQALIGDLDAAITRRRVTHSEILAESETDLADAIPTLVALVVPRLTGALGPFNLPSAADLGGFEVTLLGARGIADGQGGFDHLGLYLDLGFDPAQAGNLSLAVDTRATIARIVVPSSEEMAANHPGGARRPRVDLSLEGHAPRGAEVEFQLRMDGGPWSPFFRAPMLSLERAELLLQGRHQIEVRGRLVGDARSLDPTPASVDVVIDTEPPRLEASLSAPELGVRVAAYDVVSEDRVSFERALDGRWSTLEPDPTGFAALPEILDADAEIRVAALDEQGNRREIVLRSGTRALTPGANGELRDSGGCQCARGRAPAPLSALLIAAGAVWLGRRRRRR
ncbi:MAG: hypothetical protein IT384_08215 [Deltaproteobacteria bacterium]|nr:hypothetical protein [Deltaproteobacteria bacterium]